MANGSRRGRATGNGDRQSRAATSIRLHWSGVLPAAADGRVPDLTR
jgi:hypothetical protein